MELFFSVAKIVALSYIKQGIKMWNIANLDYLGSLVEKKYTFVKEIKN